MTDRERAIVMAYTGIIMLNGEKFSIFHEYVEEIMGRPVWTHEMGIDLVAEEIKEKAKPDFLELCANGSEEETPRWFAIRRASEKDPRKILQREIQKKAFNFKTSYGKYKKEEIDIIEVKSLEDLLEIMEEAGEDLVLGKTYHEENPCKYEITIYDYYLE